MKSLKTTLRCILFTALAASTACGLFEDDQPPTDDVEDTDGQPGGGNSCADQFNGFDPALLQGVCPSPYAPQYTVNLEGADILWIDDPANATTIGPGGWVFGNTAQADWLGWIGQGDQACGIACTLPQGHPCFGGDTFCFGGPANAQCTFCGNGGFTPDECGDFVESCWGPDGGDGGGSGAADTGSGGAADTGSGGVEETVAPDDSIFTSNPGKIYGTTQAVIDLFGGAAPRNLVAEDICDVWDPTTAVDDWFSEPILKKEALSQVISDAEMLLGYCDEMKLKMLPNGIEIVDFNPRGLADRLRFQRGDVITSLNNVPATDPIALQAEVLRISHASPGIGVISYERSGAKRALRVRVQ